MWGRPGTRFAGMLVGDLSIASVACKNDRLLPWNMAHGTANG